MVTLEQINDYIKNLKLKPSVVGGVKKEDVLKSIQQLHNMYSEFYTQSIDRGTVNNQKLQLLYNELQSKDAHLIETQSILNEKEKYLLVLEQENENLKTQLSISTKEKQSLFDMISTLKSQVQEQGLGVEQTEPKLLEQYQEEIKRLSKQLSLQKLTSNKREKDLLSEIKILRITLSKIDSQKQQLELKHQNLVENLNNANKNSVIFESFNGDFHDKTPEVSGSVKTQTHPTKGQPLIEEVHKKEQTYDHFLPGQQESQYLSGNMTQDKKVFPYQQEIKNCSEQISKLREINAKTINNMMDSLTRLHQPIVPVSMEVPNEREIKPSQKLNEESKASVGE